MNNKNKVLIAIVSIIIVCAIAFGAVVLLNALNKPSSTGTVQQETNTETQEIVPTSELTQEQCDSTATTGIICSE